MRTRSKTRTEAGLPRAPVPWLPKITKERKQGASSQTAKTVNLFKKITPKKKTNLPATALQLTPSSIPKRRAIVKIKRLANTIFIELVRKSPNPRQSERKDTSVANNTITVRADDEETLHCGPDLSTDNSSQPATENIVAEPLEAEKFEENSICSERNTITDEIHQFSAKQTVTSVFQEATFTIAVPNIPKKRTLSVTSIMTDKFLSEGNSLFNSDKIDLTETCFNTSVSDKSWTLRKYLGLPIPSIESDIATFDDSEIMGYSPIRANYGTKRLSMNSGK